MALTIDLDRTGLDSVRLTSDAVWETVASLHVLGHPREYLLHARLRSHVPDRPSFDLDLLFSLLRDPRWYPDLLGPEPRRDPPGPLTQIAALADTPDDVLESDLETIRRLLPRSPAARFTPHEYADRVSAALAGYWSAVLAPVWDRVEAVTLDDLAHHARLVARDGLGSAISHLHDVIGYDDGRIRVDFHRTEHSVSAGPGGVWLVPSVFRWPWVSAQYELGAIVVSYAARGAARVWEPTLPSGDSEPLPALLGRSRAAILLCLDVPRTTTWLARHLGLSPGTVSDHLSVMTSSGLLTSTRDGRLVHYRWTSLGEELARGGPRAGDGRPLRHALSNAKGHDPAPL